MVAGGGGGYQNSGVIGDGGGLTGGGNYPGTQTGSSGSTTALAGSFGQGGNITASYGGGGGGGWYGGGADQNNAGSGGSGYIGGVSSGLTVSPGQSGFVPNPDTAGNGTVIITSTVPCTGTPSAGTASITTINACSSTLSVSGATLGGGITYQWQSLPAGASTFTDIPGAVSASHNLTVIPVATDYRCVVTCTLSSNSDTSNVVSVAASGSSNFSENFDTIPVGSTTNPSLPECWSYIDDVVSTGYGYTIASNPLSGANVFRLYRTNSTANSSQELVLISPETNNLGNGTKQLRFYVRSYITTTYTNQLEILSMPDNTTTAGATVLMTINNTQVTGATWQEYIVPLPATTNDYFGFRLAYNGITTASSVVIDDVYYEDLSPCMYPMNIDVTNITGTTATISWDASLATGVTGYEYEVRSENDSIVVSGNVAAPATTVNVTGLTGATEYVVYVRSVCGTSQGIWTTFPENFMTA